MPHTPKPAPDIASHLKEVYRRLHALETHAIGSMNSTGFDGNAALGLPGTVGWGLDGPTGNAVFNELVLRDGIIGDDALSHPVAFAAFAAGAQTFGLNTTTTSVYVSATVTVPSGYTSALVFGTSDWSFFNSSGSGFNIHGNTHVAGLIIPGFDTRTQILASSACTVSNSNVFNPTGLVGGNTITLQGQAYVESGTMPSSGSTYVNLSGTAVFVR